MNLQDEIKALKQRIAELEELAKEERGFPQDGDEYWYIHTNCDIYNENWEAFGVEITMLETGNVFRTEEQARFALENLKVEAELRKFSRPFVWGEENWILYMSAYRNIFLGYENDEVCQGVIYFESEEKACQAIESVGEERIKKYIFGMED